MNTYLIVWMQFDVHNWYCIHLPHHTYITYTHTYIHTYSIMGSKKAQILYLQKQAESRLLLNCSGADTLTYADRAKGVFGPNKSSLCHIIYI